MSTTDVVYCRSWSRAETSIYQGAIETVVGAYVDGEFDVIDAGGVYRSGSSSEVASKVVVRIRENPMVECKPLRQPCVPLCRLIVFAQTVEG